MNACKDCARSVHAPQAPIDDVSDSEEEERVRVVLQVRRRGAAPAPRRSAHSGSPRLPLSLRFVSEEEVVEALRAFRKCSGRCGSVEGVWLVLRAFWKR